MQILLLFAERVALKCAQDKTMLQIDDMIVRQIRCSVVEGLVEQGFLRQITTVLPGIPAWKITGAGIRVLAEDQEIRDAAGLALR